MTYHIRENGDPGKCSAKPGNCPFGAQTAHYSTAEKARQAFELSMAAESPKPKLTPPVKNADGLIVLSHEVSGKISTDRRQLRVIPIEKRDEAIRLIEKWNALRFSNPSVGMSDPWYAEARKKAEKSRDRRMSNVRKKLNALGLEIR